MAAQENHLDVVRFLLENNSSQSIATEVCVCVCVCVWVCVCVCVSLLLIIEVSRSDLEQFTDKCFLLLTSFFLTVHKYIYNGKSVGKICNVFECRLLSLLRLYLFEH